ncbi:hypothetical protein J8M97_08510 [Gordonia polyisoprenivorans]|nr:hypothetical protein J8M97_08510 [Gordonia polyisoprenivorans]
MTEEATVAETTTDDQDVQEPDTPSDLESDSDTRSDSESDQEPDTFDRAYVEKLRQENGKYRQRAQRADDLAKRLHTELVRSTGKLADPTDLPFNEDHLSDTESLTSAIDELLTAKPHLAARRVTGDVGQGVGTTTGVNLAEIMRGHT